MINYPLVSIIIPCYNHESYVQYCINSIIKQDYPNIELIIIDDGSKDNSVEKIKQLSEICRQRFIRFEYRTRPNKGLPATLNEAIKWCQGKYVSMIASDDAMLPHKTSLQVQYLEANPEITSLSAGLVSIDENNHKIKEITTESFEANFEDILLQTKYLLAPSQMHRLDIIKKVNGYDEKIKVEDWYMWLKLLNLGYRVVFLKDILCEYRQHNSNTSKNDNLIFENEQKIVNLYTNSNLYSKAIYKLNIRNLKHHKNETNVLIYYTRKIIYLFNKLF